MQFLNLMNSQELEKMYRRYVKICFENNMPFKNMHECCLESAKKEMEKKNEKNKNVEVRNKSR